MDAAQHLHAALEATNKRLRETDPNDTRLRDRIQAEAALISATFGLITGDDVDASREEWLEASRDFER